MVLLASGSTFTVDHKGVKFLFEVAEEGYVVSVPTYPSCVTQGESFEEALGNAQDALRGCLAAARELGLHIPPELADLAEADEGRG